MSLPKCEHGVSRGDGRNAGLHWNGPMGECGCCGANFPYCDSAEYSVERTWHRSWYPHDRCAACGGDYVESEYLHPRKP